MFAGVLVMIIRRVAAPGGDRIAMAARLGMLSSAIIVFSVSFGPWQGWWQATIWLSLALVAAAGMVRNQTDAPKTGPN